MKKQFWKMVLAVIVGTIICGILSWMLLLGFFSALASGSSSQPQLPKQGVLSIDLSSFTIGEQSRPGSTIPDVRSLISGSAGGSTATIGILDAVNALKTAAEDPAVQYIYLKTDGFSMGLSQAEEFRKALSEFHGSGKAIVAYTENLSAGGYYLASAADKVYSTVHPGASSSFTGISTQLIFIKDVLDKLGINVQLIRHGKYKSAGEMFIRNSSSPENLEQNQVMVNSLWNEFGNTIAESRGIGREELDSMLDNLSLCLPQDFVDNKLVDELLTREQLRGKLADLAVVEKYEDVKWMSFPNYVSAKSAGRQPALKQKMAIIYADGEIVEGKGRENIAGERFASIIAKIREDEKIKAVVLRVNSPGGSVLASERIKTELDLLGKEKTLVASYGDYAASGGYWISNNCEKIYSDATTLTGSIGVFSMIPEGSRFLDKVGVNVTSVSSNKHGDVYSMYKPLDNTEYNYMLRSVEDIYERFTALVAEGRGLERDYVDEIGQGRVWTGADALGIGLVDEIGTLSDALEWTAAAAGDADLDNWSIVAYPKPASESEQLMSMLGRGSDGDDVFKGTVLENTVKVFRNWLKGDKGCHVFARMPFDMILE